MRSAVIFHTPAPRKVLEIALVVSRVVKFTGGLDGSVWSSVSLSCPIAARKPATVHARHADPCTRTRQTYVGTVLAVPLDRGPSGQRGGVALSRTYHHDGKGRRYRVTGIRRPTDLRRLARVLIELEAAKAEAEAEAEHRKKGGKLPRSGEAPEGA
jgi:hypothetical protein